MTRGPRPGQRGSAVVDFVLVVVVLAPLVAGLMQVALVLHVRATLAAAASDGARYAATADRGPADGVARTRAQIDDAIAGRFAAGRPGRASRGRRPARRDHHRHRRGAGARHRWAGGPVLGVRSRGRGGVDVRRRPRRRARQRDRRAGLARHPAAGAVAVDRALGVAGPAGRVRRHRRCPLRWSRLRPRAGRRLRPTGGRGGRPPRARRPGPGGCADDGDRHVHAVPPRLPQRHLGDHRPDPVQRRAAACCPTRSAAGSRGSRSAATHTLPIGRYQEVDGG